MIMVCLAGGLGNQLFQYAFARYVSQYHNADLSINTWFYTSNDSWNFLNTPRDFELASFSIPRTAVYSDNWSEKEKISKAHPTLEYVYDEGLSPERFRDILDLGDNLILVGEWQLYTNFLFADNFRDVLRSDLICTRKLDGHGFRHFQNLIETSTNPVAVHVRRGDLVSRPDLFVLLGTEYYEDAFHRVAQHVQSPNFFVFSDEIELVANNLRFPDKVQFVRTGSSIGDFELMRRCQHIIAANSTFSWWAAYLIDHPEKVVVVPARYYTEKSFQRAYEEDLKTGWGYMPETWLRV